MGRRIKSGGPYIDGPVYEIVGVAGNVSRMGLDSEPLPEIYLPFSEASSQALVVMMRTAGDPEALIPAVRRRVAAMDRNLPIESLRAFEKMLAATLERRRFSTRAAAALLASRWMESLVFGVSARSPLLMAAAALAVLAFACLAAVLPVRHATQIDALQKRHRG